MSVESLREKNINYFSSQGCSTVDQSSRYEC